MGVPRYRNYFITIHKSADCFNNVYDIIDSMNYKIYACILHDKDINLDNGDIIPPHYHIVLELHNGITFNSCREHFKGAHIKLIDSNINVCYQYLLHNSIHSLEKYNYDIDQIVSNDIESVKLAITNECGLRVFRESDFLRYIAEGIVDRYSFVKAFGLKVYKSYYKQYADMIHESLLNPIMKEDLKKVEEEILKDLPF